MNLKLINFFWWNTSLAHAEEKDQKIACDFINKLLHEYLSDVLVLTEVDEMSIEIIQKKCKLKGFSMVKEISKISKTKFDLVLIYRISKIFSLGEEKLSYVINNHTHKVGVCFFLKVDNSIIYLIASHWPSKFLDSGRKKRETNAFKLKDKIEKIIQNHRIKFQNEPNIILMGDYNEEPYADVFSEQLSITRDERLVKDKTDFFYNPFWRDLSRKNNNENIGTYYYKQGTINKWYTFDQIMYSSAIINKNEFYFLDTGLNVVNDGDILNAVLDNKSKIDHLPITGIICKIKSGDRNEF